MTGSQKTNGLIDELATGLNVLKNSELLRAAAVDGDLPKYAGEEHQADTAALRDMDKRLAALRATTDDLLRLAAELREGAGCWR